MMKSIITRTSFCWASAGPAAKASPRLATSPAIMCAFPRFDMCISSPLRVAPIAEVYSSTLRGERDAFHPAHRPARHAPLEGTTDDVHGDAHGTGDEQCRKRQRHLETRRGHQHEVADALVS